MNKTVENANLKESNLKEFFKNFLSIFADEKKSEEDLETLTYDSNEFTAKTARELERSLKNIESNNFDIEVPKKTTSSKSPRRKATINTIDQVIDNKREINISLIDNQNDLDR